MRPHRRPETISSEQGRANTAACLFIAPAPAVSSSTQPQLLPDRFLLPSPAPKKPIAASNGAAASAAGTTEISFLLKVMKLSEKAVLPSRGSALAAGYDLSSAAETVVPAHGKALVLTDLSVAIPHGTYARIVPRSGLPLKHSIDVGAGVIGADYRGPVGVILFNHSDADFAVKPGDRIAQMIIDSIDSVHPVGGGDTGAAVVFDGEATVTLYKSMPFLVLLDVSDSRVFLLLNEVVGDDVSWVRVLHLLSVGPRPVADLEYTIEFSPVGRPGLVYQLKDLVPCTSCWTGTDVHPVGLSVPSSCWSSSDSLSVTVRVRKTEVASPGPDVDNDRS